METPLAHPQRGEAELASTDPVTIEAEDLFITSPEGKTLAGPLNFTLQGSAIVSISGLRAGAASRPDYSWVGFSLIKSRASGTGR